MKCKRCGISAKWGRTGYCPICLDGIGNAVKQIRIVMGPVTPKYRQKITIYATEWNDKESRIGSLTDFYMIIQLIVSLLEQYNKIVVVERPE